MTNNDFHEQRVEAIAKETGVYLVIEQGKTGQYYATSPDMRGLLLAEPSIEALLDRAPLVIWQMKCLIAEKRIAELEGLLREARDGLLLYDQAYHVCIIDEKDRRAAIRGFERNRKKMLTKIDAALNERIEQAGV